MTAADASDVILPGAATTVTASAISGPSNMTLIIRRRQQQHRPLLSFTATHLAARSGFLTLALCVCTRRYIISL